MKKTFLAMLMAGSSMALFAQTTPTNPTTPPTPTNPATTNPTMNNTTWNNGTPTNLGWSNYGIWNNNNATGNMNATTGNNMNNGTMNNGTMNNGTMNSTGNYNAYTPMMNVTIPYSVQTNYGKEYPMAASSNGSWSQYGDWFYTTYMSNNRYSQIYYDQRGNGYSLALPVLTTYVPENIVTMALQKYGSNLYSITMMKSADGKETYQINLLDRGQPKMEWLDETGATALNVYRTEDMSGSMNASSTNAAMDAQTNMSTTADGTTTATSETDKSAMEKETKTKIKTKDGKVKIKTKKVNE